MSKGIPEPERMIELTCSDYAGEYKIQGKWVLYKGQKNGRFMAFDKFTQCWMAERDHWKSRESWQYVGEK